MRHIVNLALVPFFLTLVVTGVMRFLLPFSLVTTRIHIISGFAVILLVGLHLASRMAYLNVVIQSAGGNRARRKLVSRRALVCVLSLWILGVVTSFWDLPPASQIINASYESRHRASIFRSDPHTAYQPVEEGFRLKRATEGDANILIQLEWSSEFLEQYSCCDGVFRGSRPQVAIWAESETGSLIETLFLSEKAAYSESFNWAGQEQRRVDILPIWRNRFTLTTGVAPDGERAAFFSGATPEHSFSVHSYLKTDSKSFYLYAEINIPEDPNGFFNASHAPDEPGYTKPGIGQPSVLYGAYVNPERKKQYLLLDLIGHGGSSKSSDGSINYDTQRLTSAKRVVEKILVRVESAEAEETEEKGQPDP